MLKTHHAFTKLATLVVMGIAYPGLLSTAAYAGPALSFRYQKVNYNQKTCLSKGISVLRAEGLLTPEQLERIGDAQFVSGESSNSTAIIDCSQVSRKGGRLTVMTANPNFQEAGELSARLLKKLLVTH
jgi:hypothetical protein